MSDNDLPGKGTVDDAPTYQQNVDALADLIEDPDEDLQDEGRAHDADDVEDDEEADEAESEAEDEDGEDDDPEGQSEDDESEGDPEGIKGGRFAPDNAKVKLEDGRVVSIADLKRGTLFQADYTRKTTELAEERKKFQSQKDLADQFAQRLQAERDFLLSVSKQILPQPPDPAMKEYDRFGYQDAMEAYREKVAALQHLSQQYQAHTAFQQQETEKQAMERKKAEAEKLLEAMPELRNRETYAKFWSETVDALSEYGFTPEELNEADDHRFYKVFKDLIRYRKARKSAPKVKEDVKRKPVLKGQKRMDPKGKNSRDKQARMQRLKQTRSFEDGVASLMDLDL